MKEYGEDWEELLPEEENRLDSVYSFLEIDSGVVAGITSYDLASSGHVGRWVYRLGGHQKEISHVLDAVSQHDEIAAPVIGIAAVGLYLDGVRRLYRD